MQKFRTLSVFGATIALLGCSVTRSGGETSSATAMTQASQQCEVAFPLRPGTALANSHCLENVENQYIRPQTPYPDLLSAQQTYRTQLSTLIDQGRMSLQEARQRMDGYMAKLNDQALARQNGSGQAAPTR